MPASVADISKVVEESLDRVGGSSLIEITRYSNCDCYYYENMKAH